MTIGVAYIRRLASGDELWIGTDSRLTGDGNVWDSCPKILAMPRRDAVVAFSGSTGQAYPLMLQLAGAIRSYAPSMEGTLEFFDLVGHLERVVNVMMSNLAPDSLISAPASPRVEFSTRGDVLILGGFSRSNGVVLRTLSFDKKAQRWRFGRTRGQIKKVGPNKPFRVFGDEASASRYANLLERRLGTVKKLRTDKPFEFEPLETLCEFLRCSESVQRPLPDGRRPHTTGGAPQIVRLVAGAAVTPFVVEWEGGRFVGGREYLGYEVLTAPAIRYDAAKRRITVVAPQA